MEIRDYITKEMVSSGIIILVAVVVLSIINHIYRRYMKRSGVEDLKLRAFIKMCVEAIDIIVVVITIFAVLQINNINVSSMVTGVGIVTAIAGLAMQDFLKDILMGIHLINDKSFSVGDCVKINDIEGVVTYFSLLSTRIVSSDTGGIVTMCNRNITQVEKVKGMYDIELPISYSENPDRVKEIFTETAARIAKIEGIDSAVYIGIQRYADSSVIYKVRFMCSPKIKWTMWRAAMAEVHKSVIESGIEIPYNQMDVHMR